MTLPNVKEYIIHSLENLYGKEESLAIANSLLSHILSASVLQSFDNIAPSNIAQNDLLKIEAVVKRLVKSEPLQYVLEEAWFYDVPFYVNKYVLIPRSETEELVDYVLKSDLFILDIGTGSGCIPVTLKNNLPYARVYGLDVSEEALKVANKNAQKLNIDVTFIQADILNDELAALPDFDIIISNPPYITETEKNEMHSNVIAHEPHLALFVSDGNPLQFYEAIVKVAGKNLKKGGYLYFEINSAFGSEVKKTMEKNGFSKVAITKDMQGKDRIVAGLKHR
jgi:release factor glutamine methyltransferase